VLAPQAGAEYASFVPEYEPEDRYFESARLRLHYTVWGDESKPPLLLVHGGRDHARSWDFVAEAMLDRYSVYCPDLRGHGDSDWAIGGSYPLPNYVADLARLVETIDRGPVQIVGHSLGGRIVLDYAATVPENIAKLVCIEGFGRLARVLLTPPERLRNYVKDTGEMPRHQPLVYADLDAAMKRMAEANTRLSPRMVEHLTRHAAQPGPDGGLVWKFDNYVRVPNAYEWSIEDAKQIWAGITAPSVVVGGADSWWMNTPNREELQAAIPNSRVEIFENAGHWVHHDRFDAFVAMLRGFFD
jgi:pimeloyl-ACP methyl ester carboxylesterase